MFKHQGADWQLGKNALVTTVVGVDSELQGIIIQLVYPLVKPMVNAVKRNFSLSTSATLQQHFSTPIAKVRVLIDRTGGRVIIYPSSNFVRFAYLVRSLMGFCTACWFVDFVDDVTLESSRQNGPYKVAFKMFEARQTYFDARGLYLLDVIANEDNTQRILGPRSTIVQLPDVYVETPTVSIAGSAQPTLWSTPEGMRVLINTTKEELQQYLGTVQPYIAQQIAYGQSLPSVYAPAVEDLKLLNNSFELIDMFGAMGDEGIKKAFPGKFDSVVFISTWSSPNTFGKALTYGDPPYEIVEGGVSYTGGIKPPMQYRWVFSGIRLTTGLFIPSPSPRYYTVYREVDNDNLIISDYAYLPFLDLIQMTEKGPVFAGTTLFNGTISLAFEWFDMMYRSLPASVRSVVKQLLLFGSTLVGPQYRGVVTDHPPGAAPVPVTEPSFLGETVVQARFK